MKQLLLADSVEPGAKVRLTGEQFHYLSRVRRMKLGDRLAALDSLNRSLILVLEKMEPSALIFKAEEAPLVDQSMGPSITLFSFLLKGKKLEDVLRQACEAGVKQIIPVQGDHCISQIDEGSHKKLDRLTVIAKEAAQQSGSSPALVGPILGSRDIPGWWNSRGPLIFFHEKPLDKGTLHSYLSHTPGEIGLIIGPEGGLSPSETEFFKKSGALPCWLGPSVYRAETAAIAAIAGVKILIQESESWSIRT